MTPLAPPQPARFALRRVALLALLPWIPIGTLAARSAVAQGAPLPVQAYQRAERMLSYNADSLVLRDRITPVWIGKSDRFWYRVTTERGREFIYVDPARRVRRAAFDHARLAAALARVSDTLVVGDALPFQTLTWEESGQETRIVVQLRGKGWRCALATYTCEAATVAPPDPQEAASPDGQWAVSVKEHNLWLRSTVTGASRQLTTDGGPLHAYAGHSESNTFAITWVRAGMPQPPVVLWSPDSRRFVVQRLDQRRVPALHLTQAVHPGGPRPRLWTFAFPMPGDSLARATWHLFDAATGAETPVDAPAIPIGYDVSIAQQDAWWSDSTGRTLYYVERERAAKAFWLKAIDPATGRTRVIAEERGATMVESSVSMGLAPALHVTADGREVIWFSERDGWAHLYLLDGATGAVKGQITKGAWRVWTIVKVDERARRLWFMGSGREAGRDPYLQHLYAVNFDGSGLTLLSPEDAQHEVTLAPGGGWVVDRVSRQDLAPVTVARSLDARTVLPLERADLSPLLATGWQWPERFAAKAADGVTDVYGIIFKPAGFDSSRRYPVIEEIYPGPQTAKVPKAFDAGGDHRALVELGMVGVQVDGRGTAFRSKAFHDYSYGRLETGGGLEDHLAAYRQVAATRPWLDLSRVGIFGHSGGGFASARAMFMYPDFYKVAVSSAGNHDQRGYLSLWGETYQGVLQGTNYDAQANASLAANLEGKLLLAFGELDENVAPALTIQVIDALIRANRDFDLLLIPNAGHAMMDNMYFRRRRWDYFVQHLLGLTPPAGYKLTTRGRYEFNSGSRP